MYLATSSAVEIPPAATTGICLLYLTSGQIFDLVADLMSYFQGILG